MKRRGGTQPSHGQHRRDKGALGSRTFRHPAGRSGEGEVWQLRPTTPRHSSARHAKSQVPPPADARPCTCIRLLSALCSLAATLLHGYPSPSRPVRIAAAMDWCLSPPLTCDWHPLSMHASPHAAFSAVSVRVGTYLRLHRSVRATALCLRPGA